MMYRNWLKRAFDLCVSVSLIMLVFPLVAISAILIMASSPGNPLFMQRRVGRNGKVFEIYKLRTMTVNKEREFGQTRADDPEVLFIGKFLRRLKIDELPQIINVFLGHMSLVGPRPCLEVTHDGMPEWARERFNVRPGLTGLAQINGNIELTWEQRWRYDVEYVRSVSLFQDMRILAKTALVVLLGEGRFRREI
jgi:undecaprenyl phosphate N,N'-diacetylbacillosamine 1-phosphate transferase